MTKRGTKKLDKPSKPYPGFPLFAHATRRWAKKIRGRLHYFGPWNDPDGALRRYLAQRDDLHAGRTPRPNSDGVTVAGLCNIFLTSKQLLLDCGELSQCTFGDYYKTCKRLVRVLGKNRLVEDLRPGDFEQLRADSAKTLGLVALGNEVNRCRIVFNYSYQADLVKHPVKFGPTFKRPSKRLLRIERQERGPRMFESEQIRLLLNSAEHPLRAMIYLGVNCGFGNADVARLPQSAVDLATKWVTYPRRKTGVDRRCRLWPETVQALREALACRPPATKEENDDLFFITKYGSCWHKQTNDNPISNEFRKLVDGLNIYRQGLTFYALRHTFETVAGESRDQVAVDHVMGHARDDMASVYRERISDERLIAVTDFVHGWLFEANHKNGPDDDNT